MPAMPPHPRLPSLPSLWGPGHCLHTDTDPWRLECLRGHGPSWDLLNPAKSDDDPTWPVRALGYAERDETPRPKVMQVEDGGWDLPCSHLLSLQSARQLRIFTLQKGNAESRICSKVAEKATETELELTGTDQPLLSHRAHLLPISFELCAFKSHRGKNSLERLLGAHQA